MKVDQKSRKKLLYLFFAISVASAVFVAVFLCMGANSSSGSSMAHPTFLPTAKHTATVIFLHGLGDTGHGWLEGLRHLKLPHIKFICPNAPHQPVSLNGGMKMPSWFDIKGLSPSAPEDEEGTKISSDSLQAIVNEEVQKHNIPTSRIVLGGFSQGGAVSLYSTITSNRRFAGLLLLSTWLPLRTKIQGANYPEFKNTPVLQCHGQIDPMVPYTWGQATSQEVKKLTGAEHYSFKSYPTLGHSSSAEEMQDVKEFLERCLPAETK